MALLTLSSSSKPNIMLIVSDDQGYANIGYHNSTVLTPRINAIAKEGVILEDSGCVLLVSKLMVTHKGRWWRTAKNINST